MLQKTDLPSHGLTNILLQLLPSKEVFIHFPLLSTEYLLKVLYSLVQAISTPNKTTMCEIMFNNTGYLHLNNLNI